MNRKWERALAGMMALCLALALTACAGTRADEDEDEEEPAAKSTTESTKKSASPSKQTSEKETEPEETATDAEEDSPDGDVLPMSYELMDETYEDGDTRIVFPQLIHADDPAKGDLVNDAIQEDLKAWLMEVRTGVETPIALDVQYTVELYQDKAISIVYTGQGWPEGSPDESRRIFHAQVIDLNDVQTVTLWDCFSIDKEFVNAFYSGTFIPSYSDIGEDESESALQEVFDNYPSSMAMEEYFKSPDIEFVLTEANVIVSAQMGNEDGDHVEMAIDYQSIPDSPKTDLPLWADFIVWGDEGTLTE